MAVTIVTLGIDPAKNSFALQGSGFGRQVGAGAPECAARAAGAGDLAAARDQDGGVLRTSAHHHRAAQFPRPAAAPNIGAHDAQADCVSSFGLRVRLRDCDFLVWIAFVRLGTLCRFALP